MAKCSVFLPGFFFWSHEVAVFSFRVQCVQTVQVMKKAAGPDFDFGAANFLKH